MVLFLSIVLTLGCSLLVASVLGHAIHWALHQRWTGPAYRGHMDHHCKQYPPHRLTSSRYLAAKWYNAGPFLFTPPLVIILGAVGGLMIWFGVPLWALVVFGTTLVGYGLFNDWIHDSFHIDFHWLSGLQWYDRLRALHFVHHHNMRKNYGIVSFVWDKIFGTFNARVQRK